MRSERGFALVLVALSATVILTALGFAVDLGAWYLRASKLQRAADAAALAGAGALPNQALAIQEANQVYLRNGLNDGQNGINIETSVSGESFVTEAQDSNVKTYFAQWILKRLTVTRASQARYAGAPPQMGSPYNVLGTGDVPINGIPKQNYWLALNGPCTPKEDGDFFTPRYDLNKAPLTDKLDENNNFIPAANASTQCPAPPWDKDLTKNDAWDPAGYSYYIDIPKPPPGGYVDVKVYDPGFYGPNSQTVDYNYPDVNLNLPGDTTWAWGDMIWNLWDTHGTTDDPSNDTAVFPTPKATTTMDGNVPHNQWWTLHRLTADQIGNGGTFRVQVGYRQTYTDPWHIGWYRGINSFGIGAFASWESTEGCDSRKDPMCPRVYGLNAMSVYTSLTSGSKGTRIPFYFARIDDSYVGQTLKIMLWDPGEGVQKIEILAPDGTALPFNWVSDPQGANLKETGVTSLTTNVIESTPRPGVSNPYLFNDRLVEISLPIPSNFDEMVRRAGGDDYLRLAYTVDNAKGDRTTWGVQSPGGSSGLPYLTRMK